MSNLDDYTEAVIRNDIATVKNYFKTDYLYHYNKNGFNAFLQACMCGHTAIVKFFIDNDQDLNCDSMAGWNGLHWAAGNGHVDTVLLLLQSGISKESETNKKFRPLHCAAIHDRENTLRALLANGCDYTARNNENKTALNLAVDLGSDNCRVLLQKWINYDKIFDIVRKNQIDNFTDAFLQERINVKEQNSGMTVADVAVDSKSYGCLEKIMLHDLEENVLVTSLQYTLKKLGFSVENFRAQYRLYRSIIFDSKDKFDDFALVKVVNSPWVLTGETFLDISVQFKRKDMVVSILNMWLKEDETLKKAEEVARTKGFVKIIDIIVQRKKLLASRHLASYNRLHLAIQDNCIDVVRFILQEGLVDPNQCHRVVGAPLSFALCLGLSECAQVLLDHGVEVKGKNKHNQTPLHIAIENGLAQFHGILVDRMDNVDERDCLGFTCLHQATINKDDDLCGLLLRKGADLLSPLEIKQGEYIDARLNNPNLPLLKSETPVTLCLKLHNMILPSLLKYVHPGIIDVPSEDGSTFLHISVRLFLPETCSLFINKAANQNVMNQNGNAPIHSLFVESGDWHNASFIETLSTLIDGGADINLLNQAGISAFRYAFQTGDKDIVTTVISRCGKLNCLTEDFFAVFTNDWLDVLEIMVGLQTNDFKRQLIMAGIDRDMEGFIDSVLTVVDEDSLNSILEDCLYYSGTADKETIFDNLLLRDVREPKLFPCGQTLLTRLIIEHNQKYSQKLAESDLGDKYHDLPNRDGRTPLYLSAEMGSLKLCKLLARESHSLHYRDVNGETALERLFKSSTNTEDKEKLKKVEEIVKIMIKPGLDINRLNKFGVQAITFCQNEQLKKKLQTFNEKNRLMRPKKTLDSDEDVNICDICLSNKIDSTFDCGHPICKVCASQLNVCPKCRKPITKIYPLFL